MDEFSREVFVHCHATNVTEQREWQPEREQMEISVTQASIGCMQSGKSRDKHE